MFTSILYADEASKHLSFIHLCHS